VSREHRVFESPSGLISIAGGKLTTFRVMARDAVDLAARRLAERFGVAPGFACRTHLVGLANGEGGSGHAQVEGRLVTSRVAAQLETDVLGHLLTAYGPGAERVLGLVAEDPGLGDRIVPDLPYIRAEVPYAVRYEMAMTLVDFLARRVRILLEDMGQGFSRASDVARLMARYLGWSRAEMAAQVAAYERQVALTRLR
jgi:glycerol-3-phosphate dehydrogenase